MVGLSLTLTLVILVAISSQTASYADFQQAIKFGDAGGVNASNNYIMFSPNMQPFTEQFSLCAWIRKSETATSYAPNWFSYATISRSWEINVSDNGHSRLFSSHVLDKIGHLGITTDAWYHYCMCWNYSSRMADVYHNGTKVGSMVTYPKRRLRTGGSLVLGQLQFRYRSISNGSPFGGELFKLNIFSRKFSKEEVSEIFHAGICSEIERKYEGDRQLTWESIIQQSRRGDVQVVDVAELGMECPSDPLPNQTEIDCKQCEIQARTDLEHSKTNLTQCQAELSTTKTKLLENESDLEANKTKMGEIKSKLESLQTRFEIAQNQSENAKNYLEQRLNQTMANLTESQNQLKTCQHQLDETQTALEVCEAARTLLIAKITVLEGRMNQTRAAENMKLNTTLEELKMIKDQFEAAITAREDLGQKLNASQAKLKEVEIELEKSQTEVNGTKTELEEARAELNGTKTELEEVQTQLNETQLELGETQTESNETQLELEETQTELNETQLELEETQTKLNETQLELEETQTELNETQLELEKTQTELKRIQAELDETKTKFEETQTEFDGIKTALKNFKLTESSCSSTSDSQRLKVLKFGEKPKDYIMFMPDMRPFTEQFSICSWVKKLKVSGYPYWLSYATVESQKSELEITVHGFNELLEGSLDWRAHLEHITPSTWFHYCMCWSLSSETANVYYDGILAGNITTPSQRRIGSGGLLVLGQYQTEFGKMYTKYNINRYSFGGELYKLNIFSKKFTAEEVREIHHAGICSEVEKTRHEQYRQLPWEIFIKQERNGDVNLIDTAVDTCSPIAMK